MRYELRLLAHWNSLRLLCIADNTPTQNFFCSLCVSIHRVFSKREKLGVNETNGHKIRIFHSFYRILSMLCVCVCVFQQSKIHNIYACTQPKILKWIFCYLGCLLLARRIDWMAIDITISVFLILFFNLLSHSFIQFLLSVIGQ